MKYQTIPGASPLNIYCPNNFIKSYFGLLTCNIVETTRNSIVFEKKEVLKQIKKQNPEVWNFLKNMKTNKISFSKEDCLPITM
jgi:hypothetical protein